MEAFQDLLKELRRQANLTQAELGGRAGVSPQTIASYEEGRRRPSRRTAQEIAAAAGANDTERARLLAAAGHEPAPDSPVSEIKRRRIPFPTIHEELASYTWPSMVMSEDFEILAWNAAANDVAEIDLGRDLARPGARQQLRMAAMPHFRQRMRNWDDVIGVMIALYKFETMEVTAGGSQNPYFGALVASLAGEYPEFFPHLIELWMRTAPWPQHTRVTFPVTWLVSDGTLLHFDGTLTSWSDYDGSGAQDWFPGDATTIEWLEQRRSARAGAPALLPDGTPGARGGLDRPWNELLRAARERVGMTRGQLAARTQGVSESAIYSYERGRRNPAREALLELSRAMEMDSVTTNQILAGAGHDPEPSDWSRFVTGQPTRVNRQRWQRRGESRTWAQMHAAIEEHNWPCLIVSGSCEVMCGNTAVETLTGIDFNALPDGGVERNLLAFLTQHSLRERILDWAAVARQLLPGTLSPFVNGAGQGPNAEYFHRVIRTVRQRDPAVLHELLRLWDEIEDQDPRARFLVPIRWLTDEGEQLLFNVLISPWNVIDPAWAVDWHPADAATWRWFGR